MTNRVNSVFLAALLRVTYRFWLPWPASVTFTLADAPLRHLPPLTAAAPSERTILNCLRTGLAGGFDVWAMATPASSTPTSRAAPNRSQGRARYLLLICSRSFPRPIFLVVSFSFSLGAASIEAAPRETAEGGCLRASLYAPPSPASGSPAPNVRAVY